MFEIDTYCIEPDCTQHAIGWNSINPRNKKPVVLKQKRCREHNRLRIKSTARRRVETRWVNTGGYVYVRLSDGTSTAEHRAVMSEMLGRPLTANESVHHRNGDRSDNDPSNLELWLGPMRYGVRASDLTCPHCHKRYYDE